MDGITLSAELIALIGIGAALLAAIVTGHIAQVRRSGQFATRDEMRAEIRAAEERLRQELQAHTERIITALTSHRHPDPDGEPVFTRPT